MATGAGDIFLGILMWSLVMILPLLILYVKNGEVKAALLTLVYPNLLSYLAREGRFWISYKAIAGASIIAFLLSLVLRMNSTVQKALDDPTNNQAVSASVLAILLFVFFVVIAVYGSTFGMYNSNVA
jgi:cytochrome b561